MPSDVRRNPSANTSDRISTSMIDARYGALPAKFDNESMPQTAWTVGESETPLTEICAMPALSHWTERSASEYHPGFLGSASWTDFPSQQWIQQITSSEIPPNITDTATGADFLPRTFSSSADPNIVLLPTSSSAIPESYYLPPLSHEFSPDITVSSCSPLLSTSTTTASFDISPPGLPVSQLTQTTPYLYPHTTTSLEEHHILSYPTTSAPTHIQTAIPLSTSYLPQNSFATEHYGTPQGYILEPEPIDEKQPLNYDSEQEESISDTQHHSIVRHEILTQDSKRIVKKTNGAIRKAAVVEKKPKIQVSLLSKSTKTLPISRQTSCWRCRRYKKPCNGKGSVCEACVTSGFRIWSSEIGCRRGGMDEFILMLIPSHADTTPIIIDSPYFKPPSFRQSAQIYPSDTVIPLSAAKGDPWDQFLYKIQSTGIHGPGVLELLQIAIDFQRKLKKPDKVIVSAARAMSVSADMFRLFVATSDSETFQSTTNLATVFLEARKVLVAAAAQFLKNCLTGRIKQWFPTFMASNMNVFAYIMVGDAIASIPLQHRTKIWPDVRKTLMDLRSVLYPTARDLMNALSKGSQPLNMSCWEMVKSDKGSGWVRNAEGMRLVDDCEATFDAMRDLQLWRERFLHFLYGDSWMSTKPLEVDLLLISSVSRLFITPKS